MIASCPKVVTDMLLTLIWFRDRPDRWWRGVLRTPEVGVPGGVHALGVSRPRLEHLLHVAAGGTGERGRLGVPRRRRGRRRGERPEEGRRTSSIDERGYNSLLHYSLVRRPLLDHGGDDARGQRALGRRGVALLQQADGPAGRPMHGAKRFAPYFF